VTKRRNMEAVQKRVVRCVEGRNAQGPPARALPIAGQRHVPAPDLSGKIPGKPSDKARANGRSCGECRACCTVLGVDAVEKAAGEPCRHLRAKGSKPCGIYATRPEECSSYECMWHAGLFGENRDRPDRMGLVIDAPGAMAESYLYRDVPFVVAREAWPGAASTGRGATVLYPISKQMLVVVQGFGTNVEKIIGPRDLVEEVRRRAAAGEPAEEVSRGG